MRDSSPSTGARDIVSLLAASPQLLMLPNASTLRSLAPGVDCERWTDLSTCLLISFSRSRSVSVTRLGDTADDRSAVRWGFVRVSSRVILCGIYRPRTNCRGLADSVSEQRLSDSLSSSRLWTRSYKCAPRVRQVRASTVGSLRRTADSHPLTNLTRYAIDRSLNRR